jgi:hypothetical protein
LQATVSIYAIKRNLYFFKWLTFITFPLRYFYCALRQSFIPFYSPLFPKTVQWTFNNNQFFFGNMEISGGGGFPGRASFAHLAK